MKIIALVNDFGYPATAGVLHEADGVLTLDRPGQVYLDLQARHIKSYFREGNDLIIETAGEKFRIVNFYLPDGDSKLYLNNGDGNLFLVDLLPATDDGAVLVGYHLQEELSPFESLTWGSALEGAGTAGLALLGGGAALAFAAGGGSGGGGSRRTSPDIAAPEVTIDALITNDTTPELSGTVNDPTAGVVVTVGGNRYTAINNGDGTWTLADDTLPPLPEGDTTVTVTVTDTAGNSSTTSGTVIVDTTAPTLTITATDMTLADGEATTITFEFSEAVNGFASGDVVVTGGTLSNFTQVDANTWTATFTQDGTATAPSVSVADGTFTDVAGNPGIGDTLDGADGFSADIMAPTTTVNIDGITVDTGIAGDFITNDADGLTVVATLSASLIAGETLMYSIDGGTTWTDITSSVAGTTVSYVDNTLTSTATVLMRVEDAAGNAGAQASQLVTIDTTGPAVTFNDQTTNDSTPELTGTVNDPAATVVVTVNGIDYIANNNGDGTWTLADDTLPILTDGDITVMVTATDVAGNTGNDTGTLTIDTLAGATGAAPAVTLTEDINNDGFINASELVGDIDVSISLPAGAVAGDTIRVSDGTTTTDIVLDATAISNGSVTTSFASPGEGSSITVSAVLIDQIGNTSLAGSDSATVDTVADNDGDGNTVTIASITEDTGTAGDFITNDNTLVISGTVDADDGNALTVSFNGTTYTAGVDLALTVVAGTGSVTWTLDVSGTVLGDGTYPVVATVTDAAGNTASDTQNVVIDTLAGATGAAPAVTLTEDINNDGFINASELVGDIDVSISLPAGAVAGDTIRVSDGTTTTDIVLDATAISNGSVTTSFASPGEGSSITVSAVLIDQIGNTSLAGSDSATVDTVAPSFVTAAASVSEEGLSGGVTDNIGTPTDTTDLATVNGTMTITETGSGVATVSASGPAGVTSGGQAVNWSGSFSVGTYTLTGTIDAGATTVATLTLDTLGAYTFTLVEPLDHPLAGIEDILGLGFSVTATDAAGNLSANGTLTINVEDDMPVAAAPTFESVTTTPYTDVGSLVLSYGADGGYVSQVSLDGYVLTYDPIADSITQSGSSELVFSHSFNATTDELTIMTIKGETLVVNMLTGVYSYTATGVPNIPAEVAVAPEVYLSDDGSVLGLVNVGALGLIDFSTQQVFLARDENNNIEQVQIVFDPLVGLAKQLTASTALAAELGLTFAVVNETTLGLVTKSTLTLTAIGGGPIDNQKLNEFLGSVFINGGLVGLSVGDVLTIAATDTGGLPSGIASDSDLLGLSLLNGSAPAYIVEGTSGNDTLNGTAGSDRLYAYAGDDTLNGNAGSDILRGGGGNDNLNGGDGNDMLIGGSGTDILTGGSGNDVFRWEKGDEGTTALPATDTITDFNFQPVSSGGDLIDLGDMLQGEGRIGTNPGNLANYLHFEFAGADTVLYISTTGQFLGGYDAAAVDQQITFIGVDLVGSFASDQEVIAKLLRDGNLLVDKATADTNLLGGTTIFNAVITDNDGDTAGTTLTYDSTGATAPPPAPGNVAPVVQANVSALLGLVGADALSLVDLSSQDLTAADANGNLRSVVVAYQPLLSANLIELELTASSQLAAELGLQFNVVTDPGLLGLVAPSTMLTITAVGGGDIDNLAVNELLATVKFVDTTELLGLGLELRAAVLDAMTITAIDSDGLTASDTLGTLLDADALNTLLGLNVDIIEGTSGNDTLDSSPLGSDNERLYGHDGNDILNGGSGNDLLRGGAGDDILNGDDGNDVLIDGNGVDTFNGGNGNDYIVISGANFAAIDGGAGFDILVLDNGISLNLDGIGDNISNIEGIDMAYDDAANSLTLTEVAVTSLTDGNNELYIMGESNDTLNIIGATATGATTSLNGVVFDVYNFGINEVFVDQDVVVTV